MHQYNDDTYCYPWSFAFDVTEAYHMCSVCSHMYVSTIPLGYILTITWWHCQKRKKREKTERKKKGNWSFQHQSEYFQMQLFPTWALGTPGDPKTHLKDPKMIQCKGKERNPFKAFKPLKLPHMKPLLFYWTAHNSHLHWGPIVRAKLWTHCFILNGRKPKVWEAQV